jgi:tetratricopeptide (TPR) repeat protein
MWLSRWRASRLNELGRRAVDQCMLDEAVALYEKAIALEPEWEVPWFNLGLLHKQAHEWRESLRCNQEAAKRVEHSAEEPALWNLGIAATALGEWRIARSAWAAFGVAGIEEDSDEPLQMDLGLFPIRVNPIEKPEVVWCRRIDPARAIVRNVPLPECGRRYGDLVLHDGEPRGYRQLRGQEVPVFDELERLQPSELATFRVLLTANALEDVVAVEELFGRAGGAAEDWTRSFRVLCKECSEGRPGEHDHGPVSSEWSRERTFGIASRSEAAVRELLGTWGRSGRDREVRSVEEIG